MLYREIIALCSAIHTKRINTTFGQNVKFLIVKPHYKNSKISALEGLTYILFLFKFPNFELRPLYAAIGQFMLQLGPPAVRPRNRGSISRRIKRFLHFLNHRGRPGSERARFSVISGTLCTEIKRP